MKKLANLKDVKTLTSVEQKSISGSIRIKKGPCGDTGGTVLHCDSTCHCGGIWSGGCCWACY